MIVNLDELKKPCSCKKNHDISVDQIIIEAGAIKALPELIKQYAPQGGTITMICDDNTYQAAGHMVENLVENLYIVKLPSEDLHANEIAVDQTAALLPEDSALFLAVGSGTIHDITRYLAWKNNTPFISVPTAASVDGYVSTVAAMTWYGFKKTLTAVAPVCVLADTDIFMKAPYRLTASGISDLLGKYTAIADWRISHLVTKEYICERVCDLESQALETVCNNIEAIRQGSKEGYEQLMYGLILSGLAMQMVGNSRPASGSEHHFSHFWEMEIINPPLPYYHGEKVGVGLALASKVYHETKEQIRKGISLKPYEGIEKELIYKLFNPKNLYEEILKENEADPLKEIDLDAFQEKLGAIADIIEEIPSPEKIIEILQAAGALYKLEDIGLDASAYDISVQASCYVRNRLTFMRIRKLLDL
ncbi:MAG TPA: sn-glycerol-1-phosphate dehydrogenase [Clostridiales bacterium]|nr:sn-glycerol-1-phosphate dehydrogenase [Clostridiales bacterium]